MNAEYMMHYYKVYKCRITTWHDLNSCDYFHSVYDRRRNPNLYKHFSCPDFERGCSRGERCENAHGAFEAGLHPDRYRTKLCRNGASCPTPVCFFAHSDDELRGRATNILPMDYLTSYPNIYVQQLIWPNSSLSASSTRIPGGVPAMDLSSYPNNYMQQKQQPFLNEANVWPNSSMFVSNTHIPGGVPAMDLSSYPNNYMQQQQQQPFLNEANVWPNSSMFVSNTHIPGGVPAMDLSSYPNISMQQQQQQFLNEANVWPNSSMSVSNTHFPGGIPVDLSSYPNIYMQQQQQFLNEANIWPNSSMVVSNTHIPGGVPAMDLSSYPNIYMPQQHQHQQQFLNEARFTDNFLNRIPTNLGHNLYNQSQQQTQTVDHSLLQAPSPSIPTNVGHNYVHEASSSQTVDHSMPQMTANIDVPQQFLNEASITGYWSSAVNNQFQHPPIQIDWSHTVDHRRIVNDDVWQQRLQQLWRYDPRTTVNLSSAFNCQFP